jgi:hypothetical protein
LFTAGDGQVMFEVILHAGKVGALQVAASHNSGSQRRRGAIG